MHEQRYTYQCLQPLSNSHDPAHPSLFPVPPSVPQGLPLQHSQLLPLGSCRSGGDPAGTEPAQGLTLLLPLLQRPKGDGR